MINEKNTNYEFRVKRKIYVDKIRFSYYFNNTAPRIKKFKREFDELGRPWKVDLRTGERRSYTYKEFDFFKNKSLDRTLKMFEDLVYENDFDWFVTLTFDPSMVKRDDIEKVTSLYKIWVDSIRKKDSNFGYVSVPEPHKDKKDEEFEDYEVEDNSKCYHYHMLVNGVSWKTLGLIDSGFVCCSWAHSKKKMVSREFFEKTKSKYMIPLTNKLPEITDGLTVYNVTSFKFGWASATKVASKERCKWYVEKYMHKSFSSIAEFKKRFYYSGNLKLPAVSSGVIASGFSKPENVKSVEIIVNSDLFNYADIVSYYSDHNVLSCEIKKSVIKDLSMPKLDFGEVQVKEEDLPFGEKNEN